MIDILEHSWAKGRLPIIQGIVKNNGCYYKIKIEETRVETTKAVTFSFDFESDNFSEVNIIFQLKHNQYSLYCGDGSWGGDGFIYIENTETKELLWVLFVETINPIVGCTISNNQVIAESNNGCKYQIDFENPEGMKIL